MLSSVGAHEWHLELEGLHHVAHKEVATLHMLHAIMVFRVVRDVPRTLRVCGKAGRREFGRAETADEFPQVNDGTQGMRSDEC